MKFLFTLLFILLSIYFLQAQNDEIKFMNGETKQVILVLDAMPTASSILKYKELNSSVEKEVSMSEVQKITLSDGYVLYETEVKKEAPKQKHIEGFDRIDLFNGQLISATLVLDKIPTKEDILKFKRVNSEKEEQISMGEVKEITLSDGYVLYEAEITEEENENIVKDEANEEEQYDKIILKIGTTIKAQLIIDKIPKENDVVNFKRKNSNKLEQVEMSQVEALVLANGIKIYESPKSKTADNQEVFIDIVEENEEFESGEKDSNFIQEDEITISKRCKGDVDKLKLEMDYESVKIYQDIVREIEASRSVFSPASSTMEKSFKNDLYDAIRDEVEQLKGAETNVDAMLYIYIDTAGNMIEFDDKVNSSKQLRLFTGIRDNSIIPYLTRNTFGVNDTIYDYSNTYQNFYNKYQYKIEETNCPEKFEEVLSIAENRFKTIEKNIKTKNTVYEIPIKYNFSNKTDTWISYNDNLSMKVNGNKIKVTSQNLRDDFYSRIEGKKNAKFTVNASYHNILDDSLSMSINDVKRRYTFYTHIGVSAGLVFPINDDLFNFEQTELITYNAFIIFHRIGFFGGSVYRNESAIRKNNFNGRYLDDIKLYVEGGIYLGLSQYLYLKAGYTHLNSSFKDYTDSILVRNVDAQVNHGFIAGLSFIFPVFHLEGGYNYGFRSPYVSAGFNIPINK